MHLLIADPVITGSPKKEEQQQQQRFVRGSKHIKFVIQIQ
jgi:hypothetical protein